MIVSLSLTLLSFLACHLYSGNVLWHLLNGYMSRMFDARLEEEILEAAKLGASICERINMANGRSRKRDREIACRFLINFGSMTQHLAFL